MTKQVRDPLGIFDIGFSSRNVVHMLRIDNDRVEILGFENIIQRFPVGAGAFHSRSLAMMIDKPVCQFEKFTSGSTEFSDLRVVSLPQTRDDQLLVNIDTTTNRIKVFHKKSPFSKERPELLRKSFFYTFFRQSRSTDGGAFNSPSINFLYEFAAQKRDDLFR